MSKSFFKLIMDFSTILKLTLISCLNIILHFHPFQSFDPLSFVALFRYFFPLNLLLIPW